MQNSWGVILKYLSRASKASLPFAPIIVFLGIDATKKKKKDGTNILIAMLYITTQIFKKEPLSKI